MTHSLIGRRALLSLTAAALAAPAAAAPARAGTKACAPQPVLGPLESLEIVTDRGRTKFLVEMADDPLERERGMMCRTSLAPDRGMLFDFQTERPLTFWMKNTLIPLDMVFIRADGRVLSIWRNARPLDESPAPSGGPARAVLEIPGGRAAQLGVLPGDRVLHRIFPRG